MPHRWAGSQGCRLPVISVPAMKLLGSVPVEPSFERFWAFWPPSGQEAERQRHTGIYLLFGRPVPRRGEAVYVGQALDLLRRVMDHCLKPHDSNETLILRMGQRAGASVSLYDDLSAAEDACILLLRPKYNRVRAPWTSEPLVVFWIERLRGLLRDAAVPTVEPDLSWRPLTAAR